MLTNAMSDPATPTKREKEEEEEEEAEVEVEVEKEEEEGEEVFRLAVHNLPEPPVDYTPIVATEG